MSEEILYLYKLPSRFCCSYQQATSKVILPLHHITYHTLEELLNKTTIQTPDENYVLKKLSKKSIDKQQQAIFHFLYKRSILKKFASQTREHIHRKFGNIYNIDFLYQIPNLSAEETNFSQEEQTVLTKLLEGEQ